MLHISTEGEDCGDYSLYLSVSLYECEFWMRRLLGFRDLMKFKKMKAQHAYHSLSKNGSGH